MSIKDSPTLPSLLRLAVETRVQIYSHLLIPNTTPSDTHNLKTSRHCCALPRGQPRQEEDMYHNDIACSCSSLNLYPQVLGLNKQILHEAAQVLYENMEFRVRLPRAILHAYQPRDWPLDDAIAALPVYAARHIRRLLIVASADEVVEIYESSTDVSDGQGKAKGKKCWRYPLDLYCETLRPPTFPNLRHVRLHVEMGDPKAGRKKAMELFEVVAELPNLVSVTVQVDAGVSVSGGGGVGGGIALPGAGMWGNHMRGVAREAILRRARGVGNWGLVVREVEPYY